MVPSTLTHLMSRIRTLNAHAPFACADIRVLIGDDESLETGVLPALQQYNLEQLTVAEVPGVGHSVGHCTFVAFALP